jgi:hypothetical protein
MKRLTRDEAFLIAVNIAKLPSVPRQILKDIPRPPNTASRDDWPAMESEYGRHVAAGIRRRRSDRVCVRRLSGDAG